MTSWDGLNKRKFPRVAFPSLVIIKNEGGEPEALLTHTENVGAGGVCVILKKGIKIFAEVTLEIDLLDAGNHIHCQGKIVWAVRRKDDEKKKPLHYDTGIEFLNLKQDDRVRLDEVVQHLVKKGKQSPHGTNASAV